MSEIFADTAYYIALLNPRDQFHRAAFEYTVPRRAIIVTTHWVLMEVADALCAPDIRQHTHRFIDRATSDEEMILVSELNPWFERGCGLYGSRPDKNWSLTDCISFCVMESRGIREALTSDRHFEQAGYVALLADKA
jgi:uncharacterized protein